MNKKTTLILSVILLISVIIGALWIYFSKDEGDPMVQPKDKQIAVSLYYAPKDEPAAKIALKELELPIDSKEAACDLWEKALPKVEKIPLYYPEDKCINAEDQGESWKITSYAPGCVNCNGVIEKQTGNIKNIFCVMANTCNE